MKTQNQFRSNFKFLIGIALITTLLISCEREEFNLSNETSVNTSEIALKTPTNIRLHVMDESSIKPEDFKDYKNGTPKLLLFKNT